MKIWRLSQQKSLRRSTFNVLRLNYPELMGKNRESWWRKCISYLSEKNNWWAVPPVVLVAYLTLTIINIPLFAVITIDDNTANILVDQRTSNVATIISMTLAVVGLLLGNLAIKEPITYNLLFIRSRVYLIVTYTLSTIFCLILTSTLRNSAPVEYQYLYPRAVLAGTYMVLSILFLIGYLFRTVMLFSNSAALQKILKEELVTEAKTNIHIHLLNKLSKQRLKDVMERMRFTEINFWSGLGTSRTADDSDFPLPTFEHYELVYDINLVDLEAKLINCDSNISKEYLLFGLNDVISSSTSFITPIESNADKLFNKIKLANYVVTKKSSEELLPSSDFAKYFEGKLEEFSEQGKVQKANEILALFGDIYELEMKYM